MFLTVSAPITTIFYISRGHVPQYVKSYHSAYTSHIPSHSSKASMSVIVHFPVCLQDKHHRLRNLIIYPTLFSLACLPSKGYARLKTLDFLASLLTLIDHVTQFWPMRYKVFPSYHLSLSPFFLPGKVNVRPRIQ